ncbi:MAG: RsmD family RNA methyltransferase [Chitinophagales bacterium]|nr:RsmD family RNA methyltransferase [Chitinophagales bacterium]MDW8419747.1 RsmD family RNA methyltransferase [Chitinophagales bacterium]
MRIIGGKLSGQRFEPPKNIPTRPTTDYAKQGLFNMLSHYYNFENIKALDLFGGTGSIAYEFASRGCMDVTTVEIFPRCAAFIRQTARRFNLTQIHVIQTDVFQFIANTPDKYDVIFAGPPYPLPNLRHLPDLIFERNLLLGEGWFILEHNPQYAFDTHAHFYKSRHYGTTIFSIFTNNTVQQITGG